MHYADLPSALEIPPFTYMPHPTVGVLAVPAATIWSALSCCQEELHRYKQCGAAAASIGG